MGKWKTGGADRMKRRKLLKLILILVFAIPCIWAVVYFIKAVFPIQQIEEKRIMAETTEKNNPLPEIMDEQMIEEANRRLKETNEEKKEIEIEKKSGKTVYLTFDDGPSKWTGDFLNVLKEHGVQATFFMQGNNLKKESLQADVKRAVREGNYVGAHSMTHDFDKLYKKRQFVSEMEQTLALIHEITGTSPRLVRPPYGSYPGLNDQVILNEIIEAELKIWDWTIDSQDWKYPDEPEKIMEVFETAPMGDIEVILMHEKEQTLKLLPQIIAFLKDQGYEFGVYSDQAHITNNFYSDERL
ncbi:polysaccharide deacetylase family protein [Bacillus niameyensis]|uniref:polysaccharide deacetylase family protein n=1 Tax=Bacillus niameyensis TaxID=1522308 RepID=UPI003898DF80